MMILAFAVTIVALSFGLLNDSGEYLSVEGDSAAFFAHLVAQIWNCLAFQKAVASTLSGGGCA